jgi:hypothetical protein
MTAPVCRSFERRTLIITILLLKLIVNTIEKDSQLYPLQSHGSHERSRLFSFSSRISRQTQKTTGLIAKKGVKPITQNKIRISSE